MKAGIKLFKKKGVGDYQSGTADSLKGPGGEACSDEARGGSYAYVHQGE